MKFNSHGIIGTRRFLKIGEIAYMNSPSFMGNVNFTSLGALGVWKQINSFETAGTIRPPSPIEAILLLSRGAKIVSSIIKRVMVFMFGQFSVFTFKYFSRHTDCTSTVRVASVEVDSACGVKTLGILAPLRSPIPLREPFKIFPIHDGGLTLRESNQSVRLIERLDNAMAFLHCALQRMMTATITPWERSA